MKRVPLSLEYTITFRLLDSRIHPADTQVSRGDGAQQRCGMRSGGVQCCWRCRLPGPRPRASPAALKRNERPAHGPGQGGERERGGEGEGGREGGREGAKTSGLRMVQAKEVGGCRLLVRASNQLPRSPVIWASSVPDLFARQQRSGCGIRSARPALTNPQTRTQTKP